MKNTLDAIKYGLETLNVTPKELFSLIESSNGYDGEDYNRWLANEIIKIAEKDEVGYSQLLAKWFNIIQSIIEEYADESIRDVYDKKIRELLNFDTVYTVGVIDDSYGVNISNLNWEDKVDLPYNYDFIDTLPEGLRDGLKENQNITIFVRFNPKEAFKKNSDIVIDGKINGLSIKNHDALMMYRMCTIARALDDMCSNFRFVFMTDTKFLYNSENSDVIKYFLSYFKYSGFVVNSKDLYEGSFTSEEYAICVCSLRGINDGIQDGFVLCKANSVNNNIVFDNVYKRYSAGSNMLNALYKEYDFSTYLDTVPQIDRKLQIVGACKGVKGAYGYMCKGDIDRGVILTSFPCKDTRYIAITDENLLRIIAYFGVTQSMDNVGMFLDIDEIIDGHPDFTNLVSNCLPVFLFDTNSKFSDLGVLTSKSGKKVRLVNKFDVINSDIVKSLIDKSSVYFSYEAKELMTVCKGLLDSYVAMSNDLSGKTFDDIRRDLNDDSLNREYLSALSRCKDYISSLYRQLSS